jgi:hypothetical protein
VDSDLQELRPQIEIAIPEDEMHMLESNLTFGDSFTWAAAGIPGLLVSPLLFIGIERQKLPSRSKIADNFFVEEERGREPKKKIPRKEEVSIVGVQSGSLDDDNN